MAEYIIPEKLMKVESAIADEMGITVADLRYGNKSRHHIQARQLAWSVFYKEFRHTFVYISRLYMKDRTTVMYGVYKYVDTSLYRDCIKAINKRFDGLIYVDKPVDNVLVSTARKVNNKGRTVNSKKL